MPLGGVGTLRHFSPQTASVQWQPGDLTIHIKQWSLGARFLGALPICLSLSAQHPSRSIRFRAPPALTACFAMLPFHRAFIVCIVCDIDDT